MEPAAVGPPSPHKGGRASPRSAPPITHKSPNKPKPKPNVAPKPDFIKMLGPDAVKRLKPVPPKVQSEVPPKVPSEVPPKVQSEVPPKVPSEVPPKVQSEVPPKVQSEVPPKVQNKSEEVTAPKPTVPRPIPPPKPKKKDPVATETGHGPGIGSAVVEELMPVATVTQTRSPAVVEAPERRVMGTPPSHFTFAGDSPPTTTTPPPALASAPPTLDHHHHEVAPLPAFASLSFSHAHREATPPVPIVGHREATPPAESSDYPAQRVATPPIDRFSRREATPPIGSYQEIAGSPVATPDRFSRREATPPNEIPSRVLRASSIPLTPPRAELERPATPTRPPPLALPPPSYSPPPPPMSPTTPLGEIIAAILAVVPSLSSVKDALLPSTQPLYDGVKDASAQEEAELTAAGDHPPISPGDHTSNPDDPQDPLDPTDIYSVVGAVPVTTATEQGVMEAEYSVIMEGEEKLGGGGLGEAHVGSTPPSAACPPRVENLRGPPPPMPPPYNPSASYSTLKFSGMQVEAVTFEPQPAEQAGYFVVGPTAVAAALMPIATGKGGEGEEDGDTYSHLATSLPPADVLGWDGNGEEDLDIYSHVADPPCAPHTAAPRTMPPTVPPGAQKTCTSAAVGKKADVAPRRDAGAKAEGGTHIYNQLSAEGSSEGGTAEPTSSSTSNNKVAIGAPSPGGKKRSMTVHPRRTAPPPPTDFALGTAPPQSSSPVLPQKEDAKVTEQESGAKEGKKEKGKKKKEEGFWKTIFGRGSTSSSDPPPAAAAAAAEVADITSSPAPQKTSTLPSSGRHGGGGPPLLLPPDDPAGAYSTVGAAQVQGSSSSAGEGEEKVGNHGYTVVDIDDIVTKRNLTKADNKAPDLPPQDHLYDRVDAALKPPPVATPHAPLSEMKSVPSRDAFVQRPDLPARVGSQRRPTSPAHTPPLSKGRRLHVYEATEDLRVPLLPLQAKKRSTSFDDSVLLGEAPPTAGHALCQVYATVDKSKKSKGDGDEDKGVGSAAGLPDGVGTSVKVEEDPPTLPPRPSSPSVDPSSSSPPPLPSRLAVFTTSDSDVALGSGDQPDGGRDQNDTADGIGSPPLQSIQHTVSSQGFVYAVVAREREGSRGGAEPPAVTDVPPPLPPPPRGVLHASSQSSMDGTYAVCGGGAPPPAPVVAQPLPSVPPRSSAPTVSPLPTSTPPSVHSQGALDQGAMDQGAMDPTYAVPDVTAKTSNRAVAMVTKESPPLSKAPTKPLPALPPPPPPPAPTPSQGIMDPEYAVPGMDYVVSMPTEENKVMGKFHMMGGVANESAPPTTVQVHIATNIDVPPVEATPPVTQQGDMDPRGLAAPTVPSPDPGRSKKVKKPTHSYEEVMGGSSLPVATVMEPLSPPPVQSFTLPRGRVEHTCEAVPHPPSQSRHKTRAKSLKPKNRPPPAPPKATSFNIPLVNEGEKQSGEEESPTKSRSGTLYDDSGSSDSEYSSEGEEGLRSGEEGEEISCDGTLSQGKGNRGKTFYIAQEMLTTERTYVKGLRLLHEDFRTYVASNRDNDKPVIPDETLKQILGNIGSLVGLNSGLLSDLETRMENWDDDPRVGDILASKAPYLKLYTEYISKFDKALKALEDAKKRYPQFAELLRDFEAEPKCANLPLASYMLEAVQRIPRYKLLLADYVKHLPPDSPDRKPSETALDIISRVALHVNDTMKRMDNFRKVIEVCKKLSGDTGDSLITPYRRLIMEGELLKSCRKEKQMKMFFLFNDLLLYCISHPPGLTYKVVMRIPLEGMRVQPLNDPDMKYAFQITSTCKSFRLEASSAEECQQWIDAIKSGIKENSEMEANKAIIRAKSFSKAGRKDSELGRLAPAWLPDNSVSMCQNCSDHFTLTKRRHHCRACGLIFCAGCAGYVINLTYLDNKPGRVCHSCCTKLKGDAAPEATLLSPLKRKKKVSEKQLAMPAVLTEVKARDRSAQISGYLFTHKSRTKRWKRRWYVVYNLVLYEFVRHEDVVAKKTITLPSYKVIAPSEGKEDTLIFSLKHPGTTEFYFKAENVEQLKRWCEVLNMAVQGDCGGNVPPGE